MNLRAMSCLLVASLVTTGCATIIHQTRQGVGISSNPSGADVSIDGVSYGMTPAMAKLKRKHDHTVRIELAGYQPHESMITHKVSGWVFGNLVFGGLIGLAVDAISGGMYRLTPEQISADLRAGIRGSDLPNDMLYITVVLQPDPAWEKIGQLQQ